QQAIDLQPGTGGPSALLGLRLRYPHQAELQRDVLQDRQLGQQAATGELVDESDRARAPLTTLSGGELVQGRARHHDGAGHDWLLASDDAKQGRLPGSVGSLNQEPLADSES